MQTSTRRRAWLICLLLAAGIVAVYWPVYRFEFLNYDDDRYVSQNPMVQGGFTRDGVSGAFTEAHAGNWHPVTWLLHMLDCQVFGLNAGAHHLVNVGWHLSSTLLLFWLIYRMTGAVWRGAFVAALFALHPLQVESVAWVAERKNVASTFLALLALLAYVRYVECPGVLRYLSVLGLHALGLMAKPMVVTLPFVMLLLDYWPLGRTRWVPPTLGKREPLPLRRLWWEKVPLLVLSGLDSAITLWAQHGSGAVVSVEALSLGSRVANALVSYVAGLGHAFWPAGLSVFYPYRQWPLATVIGCGLVLAAVTSWALARRRREPHLAVGWFWYVGMLVPVIGLVQVGRQSAADRYAYLPLIGIFIMAAWSMGAIIQRTASIRRTAVILSAASVSLCLLLSMRQVRFWENSQTLFRHALNVTRNNYLAHNNLGNALLDAGQTGAAMEHFATALRIKPDYADAHLSLGNALAAQRRFESAISEFLAAANIRPNDARARYNLGLALAAQGKLAAAAGAYQEAARLDPDLMQAHLNLANTLLELNRTADAIAGFRRALRLQPDSVPARNNLANALLQNGNFVEAADECRVLLRQKPDLAEAHYNLANALSAQAKLTEAVVEYQTVLKLEPGFAEAHYTLANALAGLDRLTNAVAEYRAALRIKPELADAHAGLAEASVKQGDLSTAGEEYQNALRLDPGFVEAWNGLGVVLGMQGRPRESATGYREALKRNPDFLPSLGQLAWLLATHEDAGVRDGSEAVRLAEHLCALTEQRQPRALSVLAAAYAETGRFPEALDTANRALTLAVASNQVELAGALQQQLKSYEAGQPFRQRATPAP